MKLVLEGFTMEDIMNQARIISCKNEIPEIIELIDFFKQYRGITKERANLIALDLTDDVNKDCPYIIIKKQKQKM